MAERFSRHAMERAAQRNIRLEDMDLVLRYGQEIHRSGAIFIFLGRRDIPDSLVRKRRVEKLVGITILTLIRIATVMQQPPSFFRMCEQMVRYRWRALMIEASHENIKSFYDECTLA